jgi:hypothetical protein
MPPALVQARYRDIARQVADRLAESRQGSDPLSPWPEDVVVASGGLASSIARELLTTFPAGLAALRLDTLESVARRILTANGELPRVAAEGERRLAMRTAVRLVDDAILESRGMAAMLERSYRDVRDSALTLAAFERRIRKGERSLRNPRRTRTILSVWREYERLIARLGAIDPADLFERAALLAPTTALPPQLVAGFYEKTGGQQKLIDALPVAATWNAIADEPAATISVVEHETKHAELEAVCADVRALLDRGVAPGRIGIVARTSDPYDARLVNRFAAAHGFATTFAEETPLIAQRIGRAMVNLLRIRERGFPRAEVLELIRDGLVTKTWLQIDDVDAETRRARIAAGTAAELRLVRRNSRSVERYIDVVAELESLTESAPVELLQRLSSLFRLQTGIDLAAADEIAEVAEMFRRAAAWNMRFDNAAVIDALEQRTLATRATGAVFFGDVMKFRGRSFDHLFVIRMQDDLFPMRRVEDPLLPDSDRRVLGLREIGNGREEERLLFDLLRDGATEQVQFSYAGSDGFGKVLRASQLLRYVIPSVVEGPGRVAAHRSLSNVAPTAPPRPTTTLGMTVLRPLQLLAKSGTDSVFDGHLAHPQLRERFAAILQRVSPTMLEDFGECPQKFLLKHLLGVRDIDDPERELQINHRDKGSLDHRILERFYRSLPTGEIAIAAASLPVLPPSITTRLDALVDEQFDEAEQQAPPFNRTMRDIERKATKRNLHDFIAADFADLTQRQLLPRHVEYRFGAKYAERGRVDRPEAFVVQAGGMPISVEGSIDRVDVGPDTLRIVDYKSGKALRHQKLADKIDRGVRLQLAMYAMAASEFFDAANVSGAIKPLVSGVKPASFEFVLAEKRGRIVETLEVFAAAIRAGRFPAFPNEKDDDFNSCKYCPVSHACRTKHEPDERYTVTQKKDPRTLLGETR